MIWCTMSLYCPDRVLSIISMCKFCRSCAMQFRGNCKKWQRQWVLHYDNTPSHTTLAVQQFLTKKIFLSSPNHHTLCMSLWVTFGCSLLWKWALRGHISLPWRTSNRMWQPNFRTPEDSKRSLMPALPTVAGLMEQECARVRVCVCVCVCVFYFKGD
jgi:hypothetical protein